MPFRSGLINGFKQQKWSGLALLRPTVNHWAYAKKGAEAPSLFNLISSAISCSWTKYYPYLPSFLFVF